MADEIREHVADGIQEFDNPLPRWWLALFYVTIGFAAVYCVFYPSLWTWSGTLGWSSQKQYEAQMAGVKTAPVAPAVAVDVEKLSKDPAVVAEGKTLFAANCAVCHGEHGEGKVGPSLTDATWKYGGDAHTIVKTITDGRPGGMPVWGKVFGPDQINKLAAFVITLRDSGKQGATPPQPVARP